MISKISKNSVNSKDINTSTPTNPQFKGLESVGGAVLGGATAVLGYCEANPMLNVTVLDLSTAIVPRTVVEGQTNPYAGLEAFRRESSGLVINCLIPGLVVAGVAKLIQPFIMDKGSKMSSCLGNEDTIKLVANTWEKAPDVAMHKGKQIYANDKQKAKVYNTIKTILSQTEGPDGNEFKSFASEKFDESAKLITRSVFAKDYGKKQQKLVGRACDKIVEKTHVSKNIKIASDFVAKNEKGEIEYFSQELDEVLGASARILRELQKLPEGKSIATFTKEFVDKSSCLVKYKSLGGLALVLPLAIAAQPLNRWITQKTSGQKGAPIYKDFEHSEKKELTPQEKVALAKQKAISVSTIALVALASTMKKPSMGMIKELTQFKSLFPNMDQARLISATTFASRMLASQDKHDLKEATTRDIATFLAFYFVGDYVAKGFASVLQKMDFVKNKGITLVNDKKPLKKGANFLEHAWHWMKHTALKSSSEIYAVAKNGATEKEIAEAAKFTKFGKQMRAMCQLGNIAFSFIALGVVIPKIYRKKTEKAREAELQAQKQVELSQNITKADKNESIKV